MLGVFDESKGKLTLSHVKNNTICRMEPRIHGVKYDPTPHEATRENDSGDTREMRMERNARLIEAFGSQRRKKQLATAQAGRVDGSQLGGGNAIINLIKSSASAAAVSKGGTVTKEEFIKQVLAAERNIPPHNPEATTADEAYPFESIVPGVVRDSIDTSLLRKVLRDEGGDEMAEALSEVRRTFGPYVASRVSATSSFQAADASDTLDKRLISLAFLGHLLSFYTNPKRLVIKISPANADNAGSVGIKVEGQEEVAEKKKGGIAGCAEGMKMAPSTLEGILSLFYNREGGDFDETTKYVMDKRKRNLLLTWILTLAVRSEPSSVLPIHATKKLVEQLKLKPAEVASTYRELGMTPKRSGQSYSVGLLNDGGSDVTLAKSFPDIRMPRAKSK